MIEHDERLCGLAANPALPAHMLNLLVEQGDAALLQDIAQRIDLSEAQVKRLVGRGDPDVFTALVCAGRVSVAPGSQRLGPEVMRRLADQGLAPEPDLADYARDPDPRIRAALATDPRLPSELIAELAADAVVDVVAEVAGWAELPPNLARALAQHPDREVRARLASNPTGSVLAEVLADLAMTGGAPRITSCPACRLDSTDTARCGDHAPGVEAIRMAALQNPDTPLQALVPLVDQVETWARAPPSRPAPDCPSIF